MFDASSIFALGALLFLKHFLGDGPLQTSWQVRNKGRLGHPAGLTHAGIHVLGSAGALALWPFVADVDAALLEAQAGVLGLMAKDLRTAQSVSDAAGMAAPLSALCVTLANRAADALPTDADHTEVARWIASELGEDF